MHSVNVISAFLSSYHRLYRNLFEAQIGKDVLEAVLKARDAAK